MRSLMKIFGTKHSLLNLSLFAGCFVVGAIAAVIARRSLIFPATNPCEGVDQTLSEAEKADLNTTVFQQVKEDNKNIGTVIIFESMKMGNWRILKAGNYVGDGSFLTYLFYPNDPKQNHYISVWSSETEMNEEKKIQHWAEDNNPGIPPELAKCFASKAIKADSRSNERANQGPHSK